MTTRNRRTDDDIIDGLFAIAQSIDALATAVMRVARGDVNGPTGLEELSIAITGRGAPGHDSLAEAIRSGFNGIAEAITNASPE